MTILEFVVLLLVAGVSGALAQTIAGYSRGGCLVSIVLGVESVYVPAAPAVLKAGAAMQRKVCC